MKVKQRIEYSKRVEILPYLLLIDLAHLIARDGVKKFPDARHFVARHLISAELYELFFRQLFFAGACYDDCSNLISVFLVR